MIAKTENAPMESCKMIVENFRTAAKGLGEYFECKNELRVRKGTNTYRFTCSEEGELRFSAPAREEVVYPIASDATVREFKRFIAGLIDAR